MKTSSRLLSVLSRVTFFLTLAGPIFLSAEPDLLLSLPAPAIHVPRCHRAPEIDGKLSQGEWSEAAGTTGFLNLADGNLAPEQTHVRVTFDSKRLYLAFNCLMTSERSPAAMETRRDGGVWSDDSLEVYLQPEGNTDKQCFHFIGNSIGTIFDRYGNDRAWNGNWEFANDSGMGFWTAELSVAFDELGVKNPAGQTWHVNFARNAGRYTSWSYTGKATSIRPVGALSG